MCHKLPGGVLFLVVFLISAFAPFSSAADEYKPYLHTAAVPEHPKVVLFGQYRTNLFPGAATYSYPLTLPKGTQGLQPSLTLSYNSQSIRQRPGILGAGWSITPNYILREVNFTVDNPADDEFTLFLDGIPYEIKYNPSEGSWHTEVEYYYKIENLSGGSNEYGIYWLVTTKDGRQYRFGFDSSSELASNTGQGYAVKWSLDRVEDTFENTISYSYREDPHPEDSGTAYLTEILYNNDQQRRIALQYEPSARPDRRLAFEQGNRIEEARRLADIAVYVGNALVRRYHLEYASLNPAISSVSNIIEYGNDNESIRHTLSFSYYEAEPGDDNSSSSWDPPTLFSNSNTDFGVRLIDLNNDGFMDIVQRREGGANNSWVNDRISNWTEMSSWRVPEDIVTAAGIDAGVRFADINRDGFADLLKAKGGDARAVYLNNGTGWNSSAWSIPLDFVANTGADRGVLVVDVDGNGRDDLVRAQSGSPREVYLNNRTGWNISGWSFPVDIVNAFSVDQGVRIVDLNGDGLPDVLEASNLDDPIINAWLNNGTGWVNYSSIWNSPVYFTAGGSPDNGVRFADLNGDGLMDLLVDFENATSVNRSAWINTGDGWISNDSWRSPEPFTRDGNNTGRRLADVNGDGFADILVSHYDTSTHQHTWIRNDALPYTLGRIINEYGGTTTLNYTASTRFNNSEDGISDIGFNIFVVSNITTDNGLSGQFNANGTTEYNYSFGRYNYDNSEFRGFGIAVEETPFSIVYHHFHQDGPRRGKEYRVEVYSPEGVPYSTTFTEFNYTFHEGLYNVTLQYRSDYLYDGNTSISPKVTNTTYVYDSVGNVIEVVEQGDIAVQGDERTTRFSYAENTDDWILDRIARNALYDQDGTKVKETMFYYDQRGLNSLGSRGELTKTEQWNGEGNHSSIYFEHDPFGNVLKQTDSLGGSTVYGYDATHTYPLSIVNALGHVTSYEYDLGTGNLLWEESNGIRKQYEYDTFGRISRERLPYDSAALPTKAYNYSFDQSAPEMITVSQKTSANRTDDIHYYYDGFANLIQLKTDIEENQQIVKNIFYDGMGRIDAEQNPYAVAASDELASVSASANYTFYTYDPMDRVIGIVNPDGSVRNVTFDHRNITDVDENGNRHVYALDAHDQIVAVYEFNHDPIIFLNETYRTSYAYDPAGNLVKITDDEGNEFKFTYDSLGRKIQMDDPDLGRWKYRYDLNGNLVFQNDSRGEVVRLAYDLLNRVVAKNSSDVNISFGYDRELYGTLSNLSQNGIVNISYEYDDRLRLVREVKTVEGMELATSFVYDSRDRPVSEEGFSSLDYLFNRQGKVGMIPGFITEAHYTPFGSLLNRTYNNSLTQQFGYDPQNNRLLNLTIPSVQGLLYAYDAVGNILMINDSINSRVHNLSYDSLDRLTRAVIGPDRYVYSYNPLGNIMKIVSNSESSKFIYDNLAHAPSTVIEGASGVDLYHITELDTRNKNRTFEFFLENDRNTSTPGVNWSIDFGSEQAASEIPITLSSNVMVIIQNNYSEGGDHLFNITVESPGIRDFESAHLKFGARAERLEAIYANASQRIFEFEVRNDLDEAITSNVSWNCSEGISALFNFTMDADQSLYDYMQVNFSSPGKKNFTCTSFSFDGNESKSLEFEIPGLEVRNYDVLAEDITRRVVGFDALNRYWSLLTNISVETDSHAFSVLATIPQDEEVMVFSEVNYSDDGTKEYVINLSATNTSALYVDAFSLEGALIENYQRVGENSTRRVLSFDVRNNWQSGNVSWNISSPLIRNVTILAHNETLLVFVEHEYPQGDARPSVSASISSFIDQVNDLFSIRPLEIRQLEALSESPERSVTEMVVQNNLNATQEFTWLFDSGAGEISSSGLLNVTSEDIFVYIASSYPSNGVYRTSAFVNSTNYDDTETGVIIT